jgi:N-methylhydantoinase A
MSANRADRPRRKPAHRGGRPSRLLVGVDTGGTFTDIVYRDGAREGTLKLLSTPGDPGKVVLDGIRAIFGDRRADTLTYGTTVATNAMLERRGCRTALVTTHGFEDILEIGRQARPDLYDLEPRPPEPLIPSPLRFGVPERMLYDGTAVRAPRPSHLASLRGLLRAKGVESIAVCLLHSHVDSTHETAVGQALATLQLPITLSHELAPEVGEYERSSTTAANAYVRPLVSQHVAALGEASRAVRFRVLQSNGGAIGQATACAEPVRTMLSGPAGGVAAAHARCKRAGFDRIITLDMGGTSTDVALVDGTVPRRAITEVGGIPVRSPCVDIHTVGAGGGSIAAVDAGGSLKVGPRSAGAEPGPACYGRGSEPTVTDANVALGRLRPEAFLGGNMQLDTDRAARAIAKVAAAMGARRLEEAAEGIVRVVEGNMERAIRVITVERGQDPRSCALVAFGGAAGLHACGLAEGLAIPKIVVPKDPGLLSAWGVLEGPVVRDVSVPHRAIDPTFASLSRVARSAQARASADVRREGIASKDIRTSSFVRIRYTGQSLELEIGLTADFRSAFDRAHKQLLHTSDPARQVEVVSIRATATSKISARSQRRGRKSRATTPRANQRVRVYAGHRWRTANQYRREDLTGGARVIGPAVIVEYSSTTFVAAGWTATVDPDLHLIMEHTKR